MRLGFRGIHSVIAFIIAYYIVSITEVIIAHYHSSNQWIFRYIRNICLRPDTIAIDIFGLMSIIYFLSSKLLDEVLEKEEVY